MCKCHYFTFFARLFFFTVTIDDTKMIMLSQNPYTGGFWYGNKKQRNFCEN